MSRAILSRTVLMGGTFAAAFGFALAGFTTTAFAHDDATPPAPPSPPQAIDVPAAPDVPDATVSVRISHPTTAEIAAIRAQVRAAVHQAHEAAAEAIRAARVEGTVEAAHAAQAARVEARAAVSAIHAERTAMLAAVAAVRAVRVAAAMPAPVAPVAPRAPVAARAIPATPAVPAPPAPALPPVLRTAPRSFGAARALDIEDIYGTLRVDIAPGPVTVTLTARKEVLDRVTFRVDDGVLHVKESSGVDGSWDIFRWLGYGDHGRIDRLDVVVHAPKGTPLNVDGLVGGIAVGDLESPVKLELAASSGTIGSVTRANIEMAGSGRLRIARVSGPLTLELAGNADVITGPVGPADIEIAGSGSATLGAVAGGLKATIAGSGNVSAASINGAANVEIAGSGSMKIAGGTATPLHLEIMGSGDFDFGGEAVNPNVEVLGSGKVRIKSYRGNLTTEGTSDVQIGSR